MLLPLKNMDGQQVGEIELTDSVFAAPVNTHLMHLSLVRQLSNARLGTHKTKTRSEVRGGGRKPWRQKGTGRARQGSTRAPNWVGGGTVFGPQPRKYTKKMPKKMNQAALRSALTVKAQAEEIIVLDSLTMEEPRTKAMLAVLDALETGGNSVLMVLPEKNMAVQRSANNLPHVKTLLSGYINIRDLLGHDLVIMSKDSVENIELWLGLDTGTDADGEAEAVEEAEAGVSDEDAVEIEESADGAGESADEDAETEA